jgi:hypothetical protein
MDKIGGWKIENPELVVKLGCVFGLNAYDAIEKYWENVEIQAKNEIFPFDPSTKFFEETIKDSYRYLSFRYYTPESNRTKEN